MIDKVYLEKYQVDCGHFVTEKGECHGSIWEDRWQVVTTFEKIEDAQRFYERIRAERYEQILVYAANLPAPKWGKDKKNTRGDLG